MKTQKVLASVGLLSIIVGLVLTISSFTTEPVDYISKESSSYGITVYSYRNYIIVKTDNSVSVSR